MKIRVEIQDTEPMAKDGTYVFDSGPIEAQNLRQLLLRIDDFILRSLVEMQKVKVTG